MWQFSQTLTTQVLELLFGIEKGWYVITSLAQRLSQAYKAIEVEAMAAIRALEFAGEIGVDRIMVEGDSTIVTKALKAKHPGLASNGLLIEDMRVLEKFF